MQAELIVDADAGLDHRWQACEAWFCGRGTPICITPCAPPSTARVTSSSSGTFGIAQRAPQHGHVDPGDDADAHTVGQPPVRPCRAWRRRRRSGSAPRRPPGPSSAARICGLRLGRARHRRRRRRRPGRRCNPGRRGAPRPAARWPAVRGRRGGWRPWRAQRRIIGTCAARAHRTRHTHPRSTRRKRRRRRRKALGVRQPQRAQRVDQQADAPLHAEDAAEDHQVEGRQRAAGQRGRKCRPDGRLADRGEGAGHAPQRPVPGARALGQRDVARTASASASGRPQVISGSAPMPRRASRGITTPQARR